VTRFNEIYLRYLFPEIARLRNAYLEKNPGAKIISLGEFLNIE